MFCTNCGGKIPDGGNFCVSCGSKAPAPPKVGTPKSAPSAPIPAAAVPIPAAVPAAVVAPPPMPPPASASGQAKCSWCGQFFEGKLATCPKCGATTNVASVVSRSGWAKLPGRKDMSKLQFGNSVCQIEGTQVPVADMKLAPEDSIYFTHHVLLWKDTQVTVSAMSMRGGWKRMLSGLPLVMTQAKGPGHIAFSQDSPGELIPLPLQHGQAVDVREHLFLAATGNVDYDWFSTNIYFQTRKGNEVETCYPVGQMMDRFSATAAPGLLLLHAAGNVFVRNLAPGQAILLKPTALVFKDPTVQMDLYYENSASPLAGFFTQTQGYLWLRLVGPGRVAMQSVFAQIEGENQYQGGFSGPGPVGGLVLGGVAGSLLDSFLGGDNN